MEEPLSAERHTCEDNFKETGREMWKVFTRLTIEAQWPDLVKRVMDLRVP
jgi:hypothetical protein